MPYFFIYIIILPNSYCNFHFFFFPQISSAAEPRLQRNPQSYVINKLKSHDIVFLGTRHTRPPMLNFISDLIPKLHEPGVTHIGLEIASDQQGKIDRIINTGAGLKDIAIHSQVDCAVSRNLFNAIRGPWSRQKTKTCCFGSSKIKIRR